MKKKLGVLLKILISLGLTIWLIRKGEFNLEFIKSGFFNLPLLILFSGLTLGQVVLGAARTYVLMQFQNSEEASFKKVVFVSWASIFIATVAPTALIGEAYKIKQMIGVDTLTNKDNSFYATLFNKLFTVLGLMIIVAVAGLILEHYSEAVLSLLYFAYGFILLVVVSFFLQKWIFRGLNLFTPFLRILEKKAFLKRRWDNLLCYKDNLIEHPKNLGLVICISLGLQVLNVLSFVLIILAINPNLTSSIASLLCVIPLGIVAILLPISILGLGVGHIAFSKLLSLVGISNGADVFTIYVAFSFIFGLLGGIPFLLLFRKEK